MQAGKCATYENRWVKQKIIKGNKVSWDLLGVVTKSYRKWPLQFYITAWQQCLWTLSRHHWFIFVSSLNKSRRHISRSSTRLCVAESWTSVCKLTLSLIAQHAKSNGCEAVLHQRSPTRVSALCWTRSDINVAGGKQEVHSVCQALQALFTVVVMDQSVHQCSLFHGDFRPGKLWAQLRD